MDTAMHGADEGEEDVIVREMDVYVCNEASGLQMCLLAHPLRPPWRPHEYGAHCSMRVKPNARRMEVEVPLDTSSVNYSRDDVDDGTRGYKQIETLTLRSSQVESRTLLAAGRIMDDKLLLLPIDFSLQMRPTLNHLNVSRKENVHGDGDGGEQEDEGGELKAVEVQVQKRETERQQQARLNSYSHLAAKEAEEPWKPMVIHDNEAVHHTVMERLCKAHEGKQPHLPTARDAYLRAFAPSALGIPLSGLVQAVGMGKEASVPYAAGGSAAQEVPGGAEGAPASEPTVPKPFTGPIPQETRVAFDRCMRALFARHSVATLENVRQWLTDPKSSAGPADLKAALELAKGLAGLEDRPLNNAVLASGVPLACIRNVYVLRETGRAEDNFRKIVIDLLTEKESFKKSEAIEIARPLGIAITDTLYNKVVKDVCYSKNQAWYMKAGI